MCKQCLAHCAHGTVHLIFCCREGGRLKYSLPCGCTGILLHGVGFGGVGVGGWAPVRGWGGGVETHSLGFLLIQESIGGLPSICLPCDEFFDGSDEDEMPIYSFSISQVGEPLLSCDQKDMDVTEKRSRQILGFGSVSYLSLKDTQYQIEEKTTPNFGW